MLSAFIKGLVQSGLPICCAAALANVGVWKNEPVRERAGALAAKQTAELARFRADGRFSDVRQCGTIAALDLSVGTSGYMAEVAPALCAFFIERGVLLRPLGNTIYVMPPFCITPAELAQVYAAIDEAAARFGGRS